MERRTRPRLTPAQKTIAFLNGSVYPARVTDYSATGCGVVMITNGLRKGSEVSVDLVVDEELCTCGMPGEVCWTYGSAAGIRFVPSNENQMRNSTEIESRLICR